MVEQSKIVVRREPKSSLPAAAEGGTAMTATEAQQFTANMLSAMQQLGNMMAAINDSMRQINRKLELTERLTPGQGQALSAAIHKRVDAVLQLYGHMPDRGDYKRAAQRVDAAIRRELRNSVGIEGRSLRDLPRCEYQIYLNRVAAWDDYDLMMEVCGL